MSLVSKKYSEREIVMDLADYIKSNDLTEGTALASTSRMAARYNVCEGTIHRAVNKLVQKGLIYRVRGSGTYVAQSTEVGKKVKIGILGWQRVQDNPMNKAAFSTFEDTLLHRLEKTNCEVELIWRMAYINNDLGHEHLEKYDLLMIPEGMLNDAAASFLLKLDIPVIIIMGDKLSPYPFHQVFHDYRPGFIKALELIKSKGIDSICIAATCGETSTIRAKVLKECAKKLNVKYKEIPHNEVIHTVSSLVVIRGREKARYFIEHKWNGVIFSLSDFLSFGMLDYFAENHIEVGKDVFIVSYDNFESRGVCAGSEPVLTSITHPLTELANTTASLAINLIKTKGAYKHLNHIIRVQSHELIIRKSLN